MEKQPKKKGPHGGRPRGRRIAVWVTDDEKAEIAGRAAKSGLTESAYLRGLGLNHPIRTILDAETALQLAKVNGDLGRVAGLLKLWLADKRGQGAHPLDVEKMMKDFRAMQTQMRDLIGKVLIDR